MNYYSVFTGNKQTRVFHYDVLITGDYLRAKELALDFAKSNHNAGYPSTVENFHMCDVGRAVFNSEVIS